MCCCHYRFNAANSVFSSSLIWSLTFSLADKFFLYHTQRCKTHSGISRREKIPGILLVPMSQWDGRAIPFDWTAGGSACRLGSCPVCRSKRLSRGRGPLRCSIHTHIYALIHIQHVLRSSTGEELRWIWGLQTATATGMTWEEKHSNMDTIQPWYSAVSVRTQNYSSLIWVLIRVWKRSQGDS